jgi:hypothetical protein
MDAKPRSIIRLDRAEDFHTLTMELGGALEFQSSARLILH